MPQSYAKYTFCVVYQLITLREICVTFHVIAWDFSQFVRKNISECSISADAGRRRAKQVGSHKRYCSEVPPVVQISTSGGTNKYQLTDAAGTRLPSAQSSRDKFLKIGADSRDSQKKCYAKTGILRRILRIITCL